MSKQNSYIALVLIYDRILCQRKKMISKKNNLKNENEYKLSF